MQNTIAQRIADFLKDFPPFDSLRSKECYELACEVEVVYLFKGKVLFDQGGEAHAHFYVVNQGIVNLKLHQNNSWRLVDICDQGDVIGLRPLFADKTYAMRAEAKDEVLLYAVPFETFRPYLQNERISQFLLRSFASNQRQPDAKDHKGVLLSQNLTTSDDENVNIDFFQQINFTPNPFCVKEEDAIIEVARKMTDLGISSALVEQERKPVGIITDKDLRRFVATGKVALQAQVSDIMSAPVFCVEAGISVAQAQLLLIQHGIGHLCVTEDGTSQSKIIGVLSEHDIVTAQATNPMALLKSVKRANSIADLKQSRIYLGQMLKAYLTTDLPISHCLELTDGIHQVLFEKCAEFCLAQMSEKPPCKFTWLFLGSQARGEQLLMTDQDHAIVFENVSEEQLDDTKSYFLQLGKKLSKALEEIGFELCPADMMASNPEYCLSLKEWEQKFKTWIKSPTEKSVLFCNIFFDFKRVYGDENLEQQLSDKVFQLLKNDDKFFAYLASDALKNPAPLSFFGKFVVEDDGRHKDEFDLKARAIMPLVDAARVLALSQEIKGVNHTVERYKKMAELEPQNAELYEASIRSFYELLRYRSQSGFAHDDSGRFLNLETLSKHDKNKLKYLFKPIKTLQTNLKTRFNLTYFT
jgi:CBS domain-containing protein